MAYPAKTDGAGILNAAMRQVENEGVASLAIRSVASTLGLALKRCTAISYLKTSGAHSDSPQCARNTEFFLEQVTRIYGEKRAREASLTLWTLLHGLAVLREAGVLSAAQSSASLKFSPRTS